MPSSQSTTNGAQELVFALMAEASFNGFDGPRIVQSLRDNASLWDGAWFTGLGLIVLRDIPDGYINQDTLYLLTTSDRTQALEQLVVDEWDADEVDWLDDEKAGRELGSWPVRDRRVLRVWWD